MTITHPPCPLNIALQFFPRTLDISTSFKVVRSRCLPCAFLRVTYSHTLSIESQTTFRADSVTQATPTVEMPSSITLTVSHLPTSTSFFLSALQPLDYVYRGRADNNIGFGSATNPSAPADFWITQEIPGVPAGAAHVAFNAPSQLAVQHFFSAALKAGGKFHGDPAVRDSSGYYSAAVIDFVRRNPPD